MMGNLKSEVEFETVQLLAVYEFMHCAVCKLFRVIHCEVSFPVAAGACFVFQNLFSFDSLVCVTDIELSESNSCSCHAEQPTLHSVQLSLLRL